MLVLLKSRWARSPGVANPKAYVVAFLAALGCGEQSPAQPLPSQGVPGVAGAATVPGGAAAAAGVPALGTAGAAGLAGAGAGGVAGAPVGGAGVAASAGLGAAGGLAGAGGAAGAAIASGGVAGLASAGAAAGGTGGAAVAGAAGGGGMAGAAAGTAGMAGAAGAALDVYTGAIGTWCGPADDETVWLSAALEENTCEGGATRIYADDQAMPSDGIALQIPTASLAALPATLTAPLDYCENSVCSSVDAQVTIDSYTEGMGATGQWSATLDSGEMASGSLSVSWCAWDDYLPAHPEGDRLARDLTLSQIAVYQAVKVPIMEDGQAVQNRNADLIQGREALVRVFVEPSGAFQSRDILARITLTSGGEERIFEETMTVGQASTDQNLDSTFNIRLPEDAFAADTTYQVDLRETAACVAVSGEDLGARFPAGEPAALDAIETGQVEVKFVPIRYDTDGSGRMPHTSDDDLEALRSEMMAHYPATELIYSLRDPIGTNSRDFAQILNQVRSVRQDDDPPNNVHYFGLVAPADTLRQYCGGGCVAGIAVLANGGGFGGGVSGGSGLGISFPEAAPLTFIHELGHEHGRPHAPCGGAAQPDQNYPYPGADIGSWGFDLRSSELIPPNDDYTDFMGYCEPVWISDYNYQLIAERIAELNSVPLVLGTRPPAVAWRTMLVEASGQASWGLPIRFRGTPEGTPEIAEILDGSLSVVAEIEVYRVTLSDTDQAQIAVPEPEPGWAAVRAAGTQVLPFADTPVVGPYTP